MLIPVTVGGGQGSRLWAAWGRLRKSIPASRRQHVGNLFHGASGPNVISGYTRGLGASLLPLSGGRKDEKRHVRPFSTPVPCQVPSQGTGSSLQLPSEDVAVRKGTVTCTRSQGYQVWLLESVSGLLAAFSDSRGYIHVPAKAPWPSHQLSLSRVGAGEE